MKLNQRQQLLCAVQIAGFAVDDAKLYLDTHCDDPEALENMIKYQAMLEKATKEYETVYGPLNANTPDNLGKWRWSCGPWPWELEA